MVSTKKTFLERFFDSSPFFNNAKFRQLQQDKLNLDLDKIVSPVQAKLIYAGKIQQDSKLVSKHQKQVPLNQLIGKQANLFENGFYLNFYLSPRDKHYFRTPYTGEFIHTHINEGKTIFPTLFGLENLINNLDLLKSAVKHNAAIGSIFQTSQFPIALIAIGSLFVNSIHVNYFSNQTYTKGFAYGYFSHGSTMLMCFPNNNFEVLIKKGQKVDIGEAIVRINQTSKTT